MDTILPADFLDQVLATIAQLGGLPMLAKISAVIMLLVASLKVTVLRRYVWDRLGALQVWVAPILGLIGGLLALGAGGAPVTAALVFTYVTAGGGAVFMHELLDSAKALPGLGAAYKTGIEFVESLLGSPKATPAPRSIVQ